MHVTCSPKHSCKFIYIFDAGHFCYFNRTCNYIIRVSSGIVVNKLFFVTLNFLLVIFIIIVLYLLSLTITSIPYTVFIINKMRNNKNQFPRKEILLCKNVYKKILHYTKTIVVIIIIIMLRP